MLSKFRFGIIPNKLQKSIGLRYQNHSNEPPHIITKEFGDKAIIILNKPNSFNVLSAASFEEILSALRTLEHKKSLVIIKSSGGRAFSAGGDLKKLAEASKRRDIKYIEDVLVGLSANIYLLNRYKIPKIVFIDGVTMGGGIGIATFATYKIATERTIFAMPEVKLGFPPNCAASYFFNMCKGKLGYYLALTGHSLKGSDVVRAGFATHFCRSANLNKLEEELMKSKNINQIKSIVDDICEKNIPEFSLNPILEAIDQSFSGSKVEDILYKLEQDGSNWARETFDTMNKYAPTGLKVTLKQLQKGAEMNLADILIMERNVTQHFYSDPDVHEGTRTVLKDKKDPPKWNPPKLEQVSEETVDKYFNPINEEKLRKLFAELS